MEVQICLHNVGAHGSLTAALPVNPVLAGGEGAKSHMNGANQKPHTGVKHADTPVLQVKDSVTDKGLDCQGPNSPVLIPREESYYGYVKWRSRGKIVAAVETPREVGTTILQSCAAQPHSFQRGGQVGCDLWGG